MCILQLQHEVLLSDKIRCAFFYITSCVKYGGRLQRVWDCLRVGFFSIIYLIRLLSFFFSILKVDCLEVGTWILDLCLGTEVSGMAFKGPAYLQLSELIKGRCSFCQVWQKQVGDAGRPAPLKHWQLIQMPKDGVRRLNLGTQVGKVLAL